jgi:hypothetical protein
LTPPLFELLSVSLLWRSSIVQTVSTNNTTAFTKTEYPPVFDGSKTLRPSARRISVSPPPLTDKQSITAPSNDLQFTPPAAGSLTLKDFLKEAGENCDDDTMHVNTFEKLMRSTNHNLLAIQSESPKKMLNTAAVSPRCKAFLSCNYKQSQTINRADFKKSRQADEVLCSLQSIFDFWNKFVLGIESGLTLATMRRKMKPRCQPC